MPVFLLLNPPKNSHNQPTNKLKQPATTINHSNVHSQELFNKPPTVTRLLKISNQEKLNQPTNQTKINQPTNTKNLETEKGQG